MFISLKIDDLKGYLTHLWTPSSDATTFGSWPVFMFLDLISSMYCWYTY